MKQSGVENKDELQEDLLYYHCSLITITGALLQCGRPCKVLKKSKMLFKEKCRLWRYKKDECPQCLGKALSRSVVLNYGSVDGAIN